MDTSKKRVSHVNSDAARLARQKLQKKVNAKTGDDDDDFELHASTHRRFAEEASVAPIPMAVQSSYPRRQGKTKYSKPSL